MTDTTKQAVRRHHSLIIGGSLVILLMVVVASVVLYLRQPALRDVSGLPPFAAELHRPLALQREGVLLSTPGARLERTLLIAADDERNPGGGQALAVGSAITLDRAYVLRDRLYGYTQTVVLGHTQLQGQTLRFEYRWGDADVSVPVNEAPAALNPRRFSSTLWQTPGQMQIHPVPNP